MAIAMLAAGATICLWVALAQAWLLVFSYADPKGPVVKLIPGTRDLLRSHIDYLMMAQFLFVFYLAFRYLLLTLSFGIAAALVLGSFFNPFAFFVRAMRPDYLEAPPVWFRGLLTISCSATTVGYAVIAYEVAAAAIKAASAG